MATAIESRIRSAWSNWNSAGGMGFLVQESQTLELKVESDPVPFPEHVLIDYSAHGRKQTENISKKLKSFAEVS